MAKNNYLTRFSVLRRIEHWVLFGSFTTLAITGLIQKFATLGFSQWVIGVLGGIETTRIIHRTAAIIFVLEAIYHFIVMGYKVLVTRDKLSMLPGIKDIFDALQALFYNYGLAKKKPKMGRYNFVEKAEYWAMLWGFVLMGLTGFMMWNPIATTDVLPGQFVPAAKVAHGAEAILAVLAIIVWHFYHVHLRRWNWSMFNGKLTREEMEEEHGKELEELVQGDRKTVSGKEKKKRQAVFFPVTGILTAGLLLGIYQFTTFEKTSIDTIPRPVGNQTVFVPQTATPSPVPSLPPTPTVVVVSTELVNDTMTQEQTQAPFTWNNGIAEIFASECSGCHGTAGGLSFANYKSAMQGSASGPVIIPGNPQGSLLIRKVAGGEHPGKLSADELQKVKDWIQAGAPEN